MERKILESITIVILVLTVIFAIVLLAFIMSLIFVSENTCESQCNTFDNIGYELIHNGKLNVNDLCVCYTDDGIKYWLVEEATNYGSK